MPRTTVKYFHIFDSIPQFSKVQAADAQRKKNLLHPSGISVCHAFSLPFFLHTPTKKKNTHVNPGVQQANKNRKT